MKSFACFAASLLVALAFCQSLRAQDSFPFKEGDRVMFLGDWLADTAAERKPKELVKRKQLIDEKQAEIHSLAMCLFSINGKSSWSNSSPNF